MIYKGKQLTKAIPVKRDHMHQGNFNNAINSIEQLPAGHIKNLERANLAYFINNSAEITARSKGFWKL